MATMFEIDKAVREYEKAHELLREFMRALGEEISRAKDEKLPAIRKAVARAAEKKDALKSLINDSRDLFDKPKTRILHGVKIGFAKGKGKLEWDDDARVVALIRKHFGKKAAAAMIRIEESPIASALNELEVKDLRAIGVRAKETDDRVVIKPTDGEIDKMVDALLKEDEEPEAA